MYIVICIENKIKFYLFIISIYICNVYYLLVEILFTLYFVDLLLLLLYYINLGIITNIDIL